MSQKVSRKVAVTEDKEKRNSPVKEMKKKMASNAEKEKHAAEKATEKTSDKTEKATEKSEKVVEKTVEKAADKTEKQDKNEKADKKTEKQDKNEKADKNADKKIEKQTEKKSEPQAEKSKGDSNKEDKSAKPEKTDAKKPEPSKQKQNGRERVHNGVSDVTLGTNGTDDVLNGTVSADSEDDDVMLVIDDHDQDELFPELTYDDTSDVECFEPPTPENAPSRSLTRRSQVKATRTPETPRPASEKQTDKDADDPKDKVLKLKEDAPATDRKLRSADSPKPQEPKKQEPAKKDKAHDSPKKSQDKEIAKDGQEKEIVKDAQEKVGEGKSQEESAKKDEKSQESEKVEIEVTVEVEGTEGEEVRKTDTNFSKSRVKVSPYRRSMRIADQTNTSLQANYTGNNTTMEMDITESSSLMEEPTLDDSSYLRGLRTIRGRSSYKPLKEMSLRHLTVNRSVRTTATTTLLDTHNRPTGTVVGRKRKPDNDDSIEIGVEASADTCHGASKRMRVLDRLTEPFRRVAAAATLPSVARRNADIVGINTDLPLTAPVASADTFDPESLKSVTAPPGEPGAVPLSTREDRDRDRDSKRCVLM